MMLDPIFLGIEKFFDSLGTGVGKAFYKTKQFFSSRQKAETHVPTDAKPEAKEPKHELPSKMKKPKPKFSNPFTSKARRERQKKKQGRKRKLVKFLDQAGLDINLQNFEKKAFATLFVIFALTTLYFIYKFLVIEKAFLLDTFLFLLMVWVFVFLPSLFLVWLIFYMLIDLRIYSRTREIETYLPDFLQLASANVNAGMTIEEALWFAVRPRFGTLAKEMETVAKKVIGGEELSDALNVFAKKFESGVLRRTISLMTEGSEAGGKLGPLLNKISLNIKDIQITKKEMASSVATYIIFISVATIGAAPVLLAVAGQLLEVIRSIVGSIQLPEEGSAFLFSVAPEYIVEAIHFQTFGITTVAISSLMSALIVSTIKKGDAKAGFKYIPIFVITGVSLFLLASWFFGIVVRLAGF